MEQTLENTLSIRLQAFNNRGKKDSPMIDIANKNLANYDLVFIDEVDSVVIDKDGLVAVQFKRG